ncbi:MAG: NADH-quinone oxidoreductase subunit H, partial [Cyanobacteria bacterium P01_A01_bin.137]
MNSGIDVQGTFVQALEGVGLPQGVAKMVWLPLPMALMLIAATVSIFIAVWL